MTLNTQKGNMYGFVTHTWNTIKGFCPHNCSYCYMKRFPQKTLHFDKNELKTDLGRGNYIFVGSSCDMWANNIPIDWITQTLEHCAKFPKNTYLFQTKNPLRFGGVEELTPLTHILCSTIETNREDIIQQCSNAPPIGERALWMKTATDSGHKTMITIEPVMDFDPNELSDIILNIRPTWVNIGADSGKNNLPEPAPDKLNALITTIQPWTNVHLKPNLKRLLEKKAEP